jgi:hypothetical protein
MLKCVPMSAAYFILSLVFSFFSSSLSFSFSFSFSFSCSYPYIDRGNSMSTINLTSGNHSSQAYAREWLQRMTQKQVSLRTWPTRKPFPYTRVVKSTEFPAMTHDEIESAHIIPDIVSVVSASDMLDKLPVAERDGKLCQFPFFGTIDRDGLRALSRINEFLDIKHDMEDTIAWLQDANIHSQHEKLTRVFREGMAKFLSRQNPFSLYTFISFYKHDKNLLLKSVVQFRRDVWLSDDHIDSVLHSMEGMHCTGSKTRFFVFDLQFMQGFIDAARHGHRPLTNWDTNRLKQALDLQDYVEANPECDAKAFTVANTGGHWAVMVFDFRRKHLLFGDSMDKGKLNLNGRQYIIDGAHLLLKSCRSPAGDEITAAAAAKSDKVQRFIRADEWVKDPARFPVPQQNDSVSCGLAALSAIEYSINPSCELWSQKRATFFRVKYLMYATSSVRPVCNQL